MSRINVAACVMIAIVSIVQPARAATVLFVAPQGSDEAAGTENAPLASLEGARQRVRQFKKAGETGLIKVVFRPGVYRFAEPVLFESQDSGTAESPIVCQSDGNGTVLFTAGATVNGWQRVTDPKVRSRLDPSARDHVRVADLKGQGILEYGKLSVHGFALGSALAEAELFYDGQPMTPARWPNEGFVGIKGVDGLTRVRVDVDRLARWKDEPDPWIFAYWHHDWADLTEPLANVDPQAGLLVRSDKIRPNYGITPGRARWYAFNLLSELDRAGEYYLDRQAGKLYFWPPHQGGRAVLSQAEGFLRLEGASHLTFRNLTMEACRGTAIQIRDGARCRIAGCTISDVGHRAVVIQGGREHTVFGCDVFHTGEGGISATGGDRATLTPAGHNVENNHIHHYSRRSRTYRTAITISGVGCRMAHNLVHHGPHMALSAGGNDHVVEYNEIHNVVHESGDAGAYYVGRDWTQRGNVLRYNYWHHIVGATGHGGMTIYLDDQHCGHTIQGNLFVRCSRAVFIGGGDDNVVTNNVFMDCWRAAHIDNRGMGWQKEATDDPNGTLRTRLRAVPYQSPLWKDRYPTLANILEDEPNIPKRNVFARNISAGGIWDDIHAGTRQYQIVEDNLVFDDDPNWVRLTTDELDRPRALKFKDPDAVKAIGFETLPLDKMGLYQHDERASWPVKHPIDAIHLPHDRSP